MPGGYERCDICDIVFPVEKLYETEKGHICETCIDYAEYCSICEMPYTSYELDYVGGELICDKCAGILKRGMKKKVVCPHCGKADAKIGDFGEIVCNDCTPTKVCSDDKPKKVCTKCGAPSICTYGKIGKTCAKCNVCSVCGKIPDYMRADGSLYCSKCYYDRYAICGLCEKESLVEGQKIEGTYICGTCYSKNFDPKKVMEKLPKDFDHGDVKPVTDEFYRKVFMTGEEKMFEYVMDFLFGIDGTKYSAANTIIDPENYLYFNGTIPVLISVHVDTIKRAPMEIYETSKTHLITADYASGLGGDDRAGVAMVLMLAYNGFFPLVLFTRGEEHGLIGARKAVKDMKPPDVAYILGLDKAGFKECVYYNNGSVPFKKYVASFGLKEVDGTGADIKVLCPSWGISGVNVSVGYGEAHTTKDYVSLPALFNALETVKKMLKVAHASQKFPFVEKGYHAQKEFEPLVPLKGRKGSTSKYVSNKRGSIYPDPAFLRKNLRAKDFDRLTRTLKFLEMIMPRIRFDFYSMTWMEDTDEFPEDIDTYEMDQCNVFSEYSAEDTAAIKKALDYVIKTSVVWKKRAYTSRNDDYY